MVEIINDNNYYHCTDLHAIFKYYDTASQLLEPPHLLLVIHLIKSIQ